MSATTADSAPARRAGLSVLLVTCISTLIVNANTSAVTILLPAIGQDVGASIDTLQWAVTGYSLVGAAVIVTSGVLGDIAGRRKVFIAALVLFAASCALIALSDSAAGVIGGRAIQGAAGSTLLACGLSLLSVAASGPEQIKAVSLWGAASAIGAALGPLIGGALVDTAGWQGLFWIGLVVALVCIPFTLRGVEESRDPDRPRKLDLTGTVLVASTLAPLVFAFSSGTSYGWTSPTILISFAVSAGSLVAFVFVERRVVAPLIDLAMLRNAVLVGSALAILISAGAINGLMFVSSLFFQDPAGLGMTPLQAGLATLPATVGLLLVTPLVSRAATRLGARAVVAMGFAICTAGFAWFALADVDWAYAMFVLPMVVIAVGMGFSNNCASSSATASVPTAQVGAASGISNMARYVGAALLTAAVSATYGNASDGAGSPQQALINGVSLSAWLLAGACAVGVAIAVLYGRHKPAAASSNVDHAAAAAAMAHTLPREQVGRAAA